MLLSGNTWSFFFILVTSSFLLNSFAIPLVPRLQNRDVDHSIPPSARGRKEHFAFEKILSDKCNPEYTDDKKLKPLPEECQLQLPKSRELVLQKHDGSADLPIKLGNQIRAGSDGAVFHIQGGYGDPEHPMNLQPAVAKRLNYKERGIKELLNTIAVEEALGYGIDSHQKIPGLWIILEWKQGENINKLDSFQSAVFDSVDMDQCKKYMARVREVVLFEGIGYYSNFKGGPKHNDIRKENVFFWEENNGNGEPELYARLFDWGNIYWELDVDETPSDAEIDHFSERFEKDLEDGRKWKGEGVKPKYIDFSDSNNCFEKKHS